MEKRIRSRVPARLLVAFALIGLSVCPFQNRKSAEAKGHSWSAINSPLSFEANRGQSAPHVKFVSRGPGYQLFLTPTEAVLSLSQKGEEDSVARLQLVGSRPDSRMEGKNPLPGKSHYLIGQDQKKWVKNIPQYSRVVSQGIYPGVDLVYYGTNRELEYDFVVAPGADPASIRLGFKDGRGNLLPASIDKKGNLIFETPVGRIFQHKPSIYQERHGVREKVAGRYAKRGEIIGFEIASYDRERPLVIDPVLSYSTFLGGSGDESVADIALDGEGNIYVTGYTSSIDFPLANPFQSSNSGGTRDIFITKLGANGGAPIYSTYLGGGGGDFSFSGLAVDGSGNAYVTGSTDSDNFPLKNPLQSSRAGSDDVFLAKLSQDGSSLVYSTYLGGSGSDVANDLAVDGTGNASLTGRTGSTNFPTASPLQPANASGGNFDAFVAKVNAAGSALVYSTYLGGSGSDGGKSIAIDQVGNAFVFGNTVSANFPTVNPYQVSLAGGQDTFVTKLNPSGSALLYSTYLGGSGTDTPGGLVLDGNGNIYLTGQTNSANFPTANPLQPASGGGFDLFVTKLSSTGSSLLYSSYLGGSGSDTTSGAALVDSTGNLYLAGGTTSTNFPMANPLQSSLGGGSDVIVAKVNAAGTSLDFSTYLGKGNTDVVFGGLAIDGNGNIYLGGHTKSPDFPVTTNAYDKTCGTDGNCNGGWDGFIVKISNDADLSLDLSLSSAAVTAGNEVTVTVTVTNNGPDSSGGVVVTDTLPDGLTLGSTQTTQGTCSGTKTITCALGGLSAGGKATMTLIVVATSTGILGQTASVASGVSDANTVNNEATASVTVVPKAVQPVPPVPPPAPPPPAQPVQEEPPVEETKTEGADLLLALTAGVSSDAVFLGQSMIFSVTVTNRGPDTASNVLFTDILPAGAELESMNASQGSCSGDTVVTCLLGELEPDASATVDLDISLMETGVLENAVRVISDITDPDILNNSATNSWLVADGESAIPSGEEGGASSGTEQTDLVGQSLAGAGGCALMASR